MDDLIFHIKTGGTIGGCVPEYQEVEEVSGIFSDFVNFKKHIQGTFKIKSDYSEIEVCHKDSRDINSRDRDEMLSAIKRQYSEGVRRFLITHGTYTMPDTAQFLEKNLPQEIHEGSIIVITGSMYPWAVYGSDAPMNLGSSLANLINFEKRGVFICMHGQVFEPKNVTKDANNLVFKEVWKYT